MCTQGNSASMRPDAGRKLTSHTVVFLIALSGLWGCGAQAPAQQPTAPQDGPVSQAESAESRSEAEVERAQEWEALLASSRQFALAHGLGPPTNIAECFDASRYRNHQNVLPQEVREEFLRRGRAALRVLLLAGLAEGPEAIGVTVIDQRDTPPSLEASRDFLASWLPAHTDAERVARRDAALSSEHWTQAALFDRGGGPGWDALLAHQPSAGVLEQATWSLPFSITQDSARQVTVALLPMAAEQGPDTSAVFYGSCLSSVALDARMRADTGFGEDPLAAHTACLYGALFAVLNHVQEVSEVPVRWQLPLLAAFEGSLRGFVVVEIIAKYTPNAMAGLSERDVQEGEHYLTQLFDPTSR